MACTRMKIQEKVPEYKSPAEETSKGHIGEPDIFTHFRFRQFPIVSSLLLKKGNFRMKNEFGKTLVHVSAEYTGQGCDGYESFEGYLHKFINSKTCHISRFETSTSGRTGLHTAAYHNRVTNIGILCNGLSDEQKAKLLNKKDSQGNTAIHDAAAMGHKDALIALASQGAELKMKNNDGLFAEDLAKDEDIKQIFLLFDSIFSAQDYNNFRDIATTCASKEFLAALNVKLNGVNLVQSLLRRKKYNILHCIVLQLANQTGSYFNMGDSVDINGRFRQLTGAVENLFKKIDFLLLKAYKAEERVLFMVHCGSITQTLEKLAVTKMQDLISQGLSMYWGQPMLNPLAKFLGDVVHFFESVRTRTVTDVNGKRISQDDVMKDVRFFDVALKRPLGELAHKLIATKILYLFRLNNVHKLTTFFENQSHKKFLTLATELDENLLHACAYRYFPKLMYLLFELEDFSKKDKLINGQSKVDGFTPLHFAVNGKKDFQLEPVYLLLINGAKYCVKDYEGRTPLMLMNDTRETRKMYTLLCDINYYFESVKDESKKNKKWYSELQNLTSNVSRTSKNLKKFLAIMCCRDVNNKTLHGCMREAGWGEEYVEELLYSIERAKQELSPEYGKIVKRISLV